MSDRLSASRSTRRRRRRGTSTRWGSPASCRPISSGTRARSRSRRPIPMCGIAGFLSLNAERPDPARLSRMIATLRHRGPDDTGEVVAGPAALGAARLSIIDVAGGHQPVSIDGGAITVAQNGEIYNYVELEADIERAGRR